MLSSRPFQNIIIQAGENVGFSFRTVEFNHIYSAAKGNVWFTLKDVDLGLNTTAAGSIASSKPSTYLILQDFNIPSVFHQMFINPSSPFSNNDVFKEAEKMLEEFGTVVVKPEKGFMGRDVFKAETVLELHDAMNTSFYKDQNVAISPYLHYNEEYRVVVLNSEMKLVFSKRRNDSWKHNSAHGSSVQTVDYRDEHIHQISQLAVRAANALGLTFCTVDIIQTLDGFSVLEVNSQVYLSDFSKTSEESYEEVVVLYEDAFDLKFDILCSQI